MSFTSSLGAAVDSSCWSLSWLILDVGCMTLYQCVICSPRLIPCALAARHLTIDLASSISGHVELIWRAKATINVSLLNCKGLRPAQRSVGLVGGKKSAAPEAQIRMKVHGCDILDAKYYKDGCPFSATGLLHILLLQT